MFLCQLNTRPVEDLNDFENYFKAMFGTDKNQALDVTKSSVRFLLAAKVGKVAGSKVIEGEVLQDSNARVIRDGTIIFNGKIGSIFREKNQAKQVNTGQECGITLKDFHDYQKKDIIEAFNSTITERII